MAATKQAARVATPRLDSCGVVCFIQTIILLHAFIHSKATGSRLGIVTGVIAGFFTVIYMFRIIFALVHSKRSTMKISQLESTFHPPQLE